MNKKLLNEKFLKCEIGNDEPSVDAWLKEAKSTFPNNDCGIFLTHNGVVRSTSRREVRDNEKGLGKVGSMNLSCDEDCLLKLAHNIKNKNLEYLRIWINNGILNAGESMMIILIGAKTRKDADKCFNLLMDKLKSDCLNENERFV